MRIKVFVSFLFFAFVFVFSDCFCFCCCGCCLHSEMIVLRFPSVPFLWLLFHLAEATAFESCFLFSGVHASAWSIIYYGYIARKHGLTGVCLDSLSRIHTIPSVPIVDCFQKIRQQVKCYLQMAGIHINFSLFVMLLLLLYYETSLDQK